MIQKNTIMLYSCLATILSCILLLILIFNHQIETIGFEEVEATIDKYYITGKVPATYVKFKDSSGNNYSSRYNCKSSTKPINTTVVLFIRKEKFIIPFIYSKNFNNIINCSVVVCN